MKQLIKNSDGNGIKNNKMGSLQLQQRVESLIRSLIAAYPKIEGEILYLRGIFVDSVKSLNKEYWKVVRKYEKLKENIYAKQQELSKSKEKELMKQTSFSTKANCDYDIDLMSLILSEAKSIKQIFEQSLKSTLTLQSYHQTIKSSTFINIYNTYKDFYQFFKQRHKDYIKNCSYDQKDIHENSTALKQRLIDQLQREILKRQNLQQKYSALKHKYHQIQKLKIELLEHQNQHQTLLQNKIFQLCSKCQVLFKHPILKSQKSKKVIGKFIQTQEKLHKKLLTQSLQKSQKSHSEIEYSQGTSQNSQSKEDFTRLSSKLNIGKFYMTSNVIQTLKVNCQQTNKIGDIDKELENEKLIYSSQKQSEMKKSLEYRMTFGNQKQQNKNIKKKKLEKLDQINDQNNNPLQNQAQRLHKELQRQRDQNQRLNQKQRQSDIQYRRLQEQVNELYKLMSERQNKEISSQGQQDKNGENKIQKILIQQAEKSKFQISKFSPYKIQPPGKSRVRSENKNKTELKQTEEYSNGRLRQKDEETLYFKEQDEKEKLIYNQLMMMLLTQASSLEEFIRKQQQHRQNTSF